VTLYAATFGRGVWQLPLVIVDPSDSDGIPDDQDNCVYVDNANQLDIDNDGIGNMCDPDFNQDCVVNFLDISAFTANFMSSAPLYDLNSDGAVNFLDYVVVVNSYIQPPGPSGVPNVCNP
jgi:hypothetical protein